MTSDGINYENQLINFCTRFETIGMNLITGSYLIMFLNLRAISRSKMKKTFLLKNIICKRNLVSYITAIFSFTEKQLWE